MPNPEDPGAFVLAIKLADEVGAKVIFATDPDCDRVGIAVKNKEKPDVETAKKYLAQSALWNAGIFAFKLGYLLDKAHSMIDFEDYRDLFNKYDTLTKISFDYAVVEKEPSIQVLRYSGDWKDVGTWNMMAEVMADKTKGKAIKAVYDFLTVSFSTGFVSVY